jgi:hypothetical protein
LIAAALFLMLSSCNFTSPKNDRSSVTVRLPPARPATPEPSFSFGRQSSAIPVRSDG